MRTAKARLNRTAAVVLLTLLATGLFSFQASAQITLKLWIVDFLTGTQELLSSKILREFEAAHPGITVEEEYIGWDIYSQRFVTGWAAGTGPDVFGAGPHWLGGIVERGMTRPLDEYIERWPDASDFYPITWEAVTWRGERHGIPYKQETWSLIYRADLFEQAGIGADSPAATWNELKEYQAKLSRTDGQGNITQIGVVVPNTGPTMFHWWVALLYQAGGRLVSEDGLRPLFNSAEGLEASNFYLELYLFNESLGQMPTSTLNLVNGGAAMHYANPGWFLPGAQLNNPETVPFFRTSPPLTGRRKVSITYTNLLAMSSQTEHPDEAFELMKWLTSTQNMVDYARTFYSVPPRRSAVASDYVQNTPIVRQEIEEVLPFAERWPSHNEENQNILRNMWPQVMTREISPQQALQNAAAAWLGW